MRRTRRTRSSQDTNKFSRSADLRANWHCVFTLPGTEQAQKERVCNLYRMPTDEEVKKYKYSHETHVRCRSDDVEDSVRYINRPGMRNSKIPLTLRLKTSSNENEIKYTRIEPICLIENEQEADHEIDKINNGTPGRQKRQKKPPKIMTNDTPDVVTVPRSVGSIQLKAQLVDYALKSKKTKSNEESRKANLKLNSACKQSARDITDEIARRVENKGIEQVEEEKEKKDNEEANHEKVFEITKDDTTENSGEDSDESFESPQTSTSLSPNRPNGESDQGATAVAADDAVGTALKSTVAAKNDNKIIVTDQQVLSTKIIILKETESDKEEKYSASSPQERISVKKRSTETTDIIQICVRTPKKGHQSETQIEQTSLPHPVDNGDIDEPVIAGTPKVTQDREKNKKKFPRSLYTTIASIEYDKKIGQIATAGGSSKPLTTNGEESSKKKGKNRSDSNQGTSSCCSDIHVKLTKKIDTLIDRKLAKFRLQLAEDRQKELRRQNIGHCTENDDGQNDDESMYDQSNLPQSNEDGKINYDGGMFDREYLVKAIGASTNQSRVKNVMLALWNVEEVNKMYLFTKIEDQDHKLMTLNESKTVEDVMKKMAKNSTINNRKMLNEPITTKNVRKWISNSLKEHRRTYNLDPEKRQERLATNRKNIRKKRELAKKNASAKSQKKKNRNISYKEQKSSDSESDYKDDDDEDADGNADEDADADENADEDADANENADEDADADERAPDRGMNVGQTCKANVSQQLNDDGDEESGEENDEVEFELLRRETDKSIRHCIKKILETSPYTRNEQTSKERGLVPKYFLEHCIVNEETMNKIFASDVVIVDNEGNYRIVDYKDEMTALVELFTWMKKKEILKEHTILLDSASLMDTNNNSDACPLNEKLTKYLIAKYMSITNRQVRSDTVLRLNNSALLTAIPYGIMIKKSKENGSTEMTISEIIEECSNILPCNKITNEQWKRSIEENGQTDEDDSDKIQFDESITKKSISSVPTIMERLDFYIFDHVPECRSPPSPPRRVNIKRKR